MEDKLKANKAALMEWDRMDDMAIGHMTLHLSASIQEEVSLLNTTFSIWDCLEDCYGKATPTTVYKDFKEALSVCLHTDQNQLHSFGVWFLKPHVLRNPPIWLTMAHTVNSNGFSPSALKTFGLIRVDKLCIMSISRTNRHNRRSIYLCNWLEKYVDKVNGTGGTAACESGGIARPGGVIPGVWVGEGANTSPCMGGTIPGAEVGEETVTCACKGNTGPGSVIPECSVVRGGTFTVERALGFVHFPDCSPPVYRSL